MYTWNYGNTYIKIFFSFTNTLICNYSPRKIKYGNEQIFYDRDYYTDSYNYIIICALFLTV